MENKEIKEEYNPCYDCYNCREIDNTACQEDGDCRDCARLEERFENNEKAKEKVKSVALHERLKALGVVK